MSKIIHQLNVIKRKKKAYEKASERCQELSKEEKNKKQQYGSERYKNLSEDEKYRRKYYKLWKNKIASQIKTD